MEVVPGDQVASRGIRTPDRVSGRGDNDAEVCVAEVRISRGIRADEITFQNIIAAGLQNNTVLSESIDHQSSHGAPSTADIKPGERAPRIFSIKLNQQNSIISVG